MKSRSHRRARRVHHVRGQLRLGQRFASFYDPAARTVENEIFIRANGMKLGDVAQSHDPSTKGADTSW